MKILETNYTNKQKAKEETNKQTNKTRKRKEEENGSVYQQKQYI